MSDNNSKWNVERLPHHHFAITDDGQFKCGIDGRDVRLAFVAEIVDWYSVGMLDTDDYALGVSFSIFVHPDDVSDEYAAEAGYDGDYTLYDATTHGNGVSVNPFDEVNKDETISVDHRVRTSDTGRKNDHPMFDNYDDARDYIDEMLPRLTAIAGMVGFWLDRPVNRIGSTGWDLLYEQIGRDGPSGIMAAMERRTAD